MRDQVITDPDEWLASAERAERARVREQQDRQWIYRNYNAALIADVGATMSLLGIFEKPSRSFYLASMSLEDTPANYEYFTQVSDWFHLRNEPRRYVVGMNLVPGEKSIMWDLIDTKEDKVLYSGVTACVEILGR
jgi:hypothetical protein